MKPLKEFFDSFPDWKREHVKRIHSAIYNAAVGMDDSEIEGIVKDTLNRARRDLSS